MSRHTPGPWDASGQGGEFTIWRRYRDGEGRRVHRPVAQALDVAGMSFEERAANAGLIAAAPDLLAALRALVDLDDGDKPSLWPISAELEAGRVAIAKAEGR